MEEGVLNDLDRLLSCEVSTMYTIGKNLSDKPSQRAEQLRNGKKNLVEGRAYLNACQIISLWPPVSVSYIKLRVSDRSKTMQTAPSYLTT